VNRRILIASTLGAVLFIGGGSFLLKLAASREAAENESNTFMAKFGRAVLAGL
jgi:hypothetical protein